MFNSSEYTLQLLSEASEEAAILREWYRGVQRVLALIEWIPNGTSRHCPLCHRMEIDGHISTCGINQFLHKPIQATDVLHTAASFEPNHILE